MNTFDLLAYFRCLGGTQPCRNDTFALDNSYVADPGFVKMNATVAQQLTPLVSGFVSVDNLTETMTSTSS